MPVEPWTPRGEGTRPGYNSPGSKRDTATELLDLYEPPGEYMVTVGGRP